MDTKEVISVVDKSTIYIDPEYVRILERVESVHANGLALANVLISLLAVILAVAGILVTFWMWWNSREQKKERRLLSNTYEKQLNVLIATYEEKISALVDEIAKIASDVRDDGADVSSTKTELENIVENYRNKLNEVERIKEVSDNQFVVTIPVAKSMPNTLYSNTLQTLVNLSDSLHQIVNCVHCGKQYKTNNLITNVLHKNVCPHCGGDV